MILWFKRRLLSRYKFVVGAILLSYLLICYFGSGSLIHPTASEYLGKVSENFWASPDLGPVETAGAWGEDGRGPADEHEATADATVSSQTGAPYGASVAEGHVAIASGHADNAHATLELKKEDYVRAIIDPNDDSTPRLTCPPFDAYRYDYLRVPDQERRAKYFFAMNLRQVVDLLPRLLGSTVDAIHFLGPRNSVLSVVEGNSDDGTWEVLSALKPRLEALGVTFFLVRSDIDPAASEDRIGKLAELRSQAVEPLRNSRSDKARLLDLPGSDVEFTDDATVVFLNDVAACTEDILELIHQRVLQEADMTCAMDWFYPEDRDKPGLFYDVWISRTLSGNLFFDIPKDGSWEASDHLLPFDPNERARFAAHRPFQVFSCWNGAVAFTAEPVLEGRVDFRRAKDEECFQGEPQLFCKDMWFDGHGRIAVVPTVNLEYTDRKGRWAKQDRGYTSDWTVMEDDDLGDGLPMRIDWKGPPRLVKCMPEFFRQSWLPWNESLGEV